jgi:hypothetical protein
MEEQRGRLNHTSRQQRNSTEVVLLTPTLRLLSGGTARFFERRMEDRLGTLRSGILDGLNFTGLRSQTRILELPWTALTDLSAPPTAEHPGNGNGPL